MPQVPPGKACSLWPASLAMIPRQLGALWDMEARRGMEVWRGMEARLVWGLMLAALAGKVCSSRCRSTRSSNSGCCSSSSSYSNNSNS